MVTSAKEIMNKLARESSLLKIVDGEMQKNLQGILLAMLDDVHTVCVKNHIKYSLCGGTLLGAVRHKGFIPWDDDIDIMMPRSDWEHFKGIFEKELGKEYILEAPNYVDKDCKVTWGKIYKKGTTLMEIQDLKTPYCNGIFLDIFIMENVSDSKFIRAIDAKVSDFMKGVATSMVYYKYPNDLLDAFYGSTPESKRYYQMRRFLGFLFSWCSHKRWCSWFDRYVSRHKEGQYTTVPTGRKNYIGEMLPNGYFATTVPIEFSGHTFYAFRDWEITLLNLYGKSYMQLPPEDKRERHFVYKLEF